MKRGGWECLEIFRVVGGQIKGQRVGRDWERMGVRGRWRKKLKDITA